MSSSKTPSLPKPKDLSHRLSQNTQTRAESNIKGFYKYFAIPGIGQIAGGLPNPNNFPFDTLEAHAALPDRYEPSPPSKPDDPSVINLQSASVHPAYPSSHIDVPKDSRVTERAHRIDLATALQYGTSEGYPPLKNFLRQFTRDVMHPGETYEGGPEIILTNGSTDGFSKFLQLCSNEWIAKRHSLVEREGLLVEEFAYMLAIQSASSRGLNIVPVAVDDEGMCASGPRGLERVLANWDHTNGRRPHMMYTVTIGQNPTSGTLSLQRRRDIYKLCQQYDIVLCEDDPYWYLQYPSAISSTGTRNVQACAGSRSDVHELSSSGYDFLDSMVPSYVSLDVDGRVVRLDTFSKTIAPGCRLGWITAQPRLIERLQRITETATQQPSGFVQSIVAELLLGPQSPADPGRGGGPSGQGFQVDGWVRWLEGLRGNYERRMNAMCGVLEGRKFLVKLGRRPSLDWDESKGEAGWAVVEQGKQMFEFRWPTGGMFVWLEVFFANHALYDTNASPSSPASASPTRFTGMQLSRALWVLWTRKPYRVLVSPGSIFSTGADLTQMAWRFYRLCFAACEEEQVGHLSERLAAGINAFWEVRNPDFVRQLLHEMDRDAAVRGQPQTVYLAGPC